MSPQIILGIFDLIKGIAWPLLIAILAVAYRPRIIALKPTFLAVLKRLTKIKLWEVEVGLNPVAQQQKAGDLVKADNGTIELKELSGYMRTDAIAQLERRLLANLKTIPENQTEILVRQLAQARLEAAFGIVYAGIFGSQIAGLIELEARRKVPTDEAVAFFKLFAEKYPEFYAGYGYSGWINFVKNRGLVEQVGNDLAITPLGEDFIKWLKATQLSINKAW